MARRSLRPHLNQIRGWVRQGRTDAWIAHQLEVTVQQIEAFKRENELAARRARRADGSGARLRRRDRPPRRGRRAHRRRARGRRGRAPRRSAARPRRRPAGPRRRREGRAAARRAEAGDDEDDRGRGRRGRRTRTPPSRGAAGGAAGAGAARPARRELEGTFDHGEEGYGLWLDPAVADNPVYAEHWAGHRPVERHDRGGPDRDPPRRRGRRRRRLTTPSSPGRSRSGAGSSAACSEQSIVHPVRRGLPQPQARARLRPATRCTSTPRSTPTNSSPRSTTCTATTCHRRAYVERFDTGERIADVLARGAAGSSSATCSWSCAGRGTARRSPASPARSTRRRCRSPRREASARSPTARTRRSCANSSRCAPRSRGPCRRRGSSSARRRASTRPVTTLYSDGVVAQIEDVATLRDFRRRGLARATVSAAIDAALEMGHELIFIVADDDDWPQGPLRAARVRPGRPGVGVHPAGPGASGARRDAVAGAGSAPPRRRGRVSSAASAGRPRSRWPRARSGRTRRRPRSAGPRPTARRARR